MRGKRKKGCLPVILVGVVILALLAAFVYVRKLYNDTLTRIDNQMAALPKFDETAVAKSIAKELKISYPVKPPEKTKSQLESMARVQAKKMADAEYPLRKLALRVSSILKKIRCVKRGDHVRFYLNTTRKYIEGSFQRILKERKDKFVVVDLNKYPFCDISSDYYYLFDPELAREKAAEKVKEAKRDFKQRKREYRQTTQEALRIKLFGKYGYIRKDGVWTSNYDILNARLAEEKLDFQRKIRRKKAKILEDNQLFGLIPLTPRNQQKRIDDEKASVQTSDDGNQSDKKE